MKQTFKVGTIPSTKDKYFEEVKETLVDLGAVEEGTPDSKLANEVKNGIGQSLEALSNVKQALIEKGVADESITNGECAEKIKNISTLKGYLDLTKSTENMFNIDDENFVSINHIINYEDTENVTNMSNMFKNGIKYLKEFPILNTSKVTNMSDMFSPGLTSSYNKYIENIPYMDTSNVVNMSGAFKGLLKLKTIPPLNTSKVTNMSYLIGTYNSSGFTTHYFEEMPLIDTSQVTSMQGMFAGCINLKTIPLLNTSKVTNMTAMFYGCSNLESIPALDFSKVTGWDNTFNKCEKLEEINIGIIKPNRLSYTFYGCTNLKKIKGTIDLNGRTQIQSGFGSCTNLTEVNIINIYSDLKIGSSTSCTLLTLDTLINLCKECINRGYTYTLTIGSVNIEKIANVYVKFTDPSVTSIATGKKGDVVVCENTDEGAMTITEYMALKSWTLA